jgi:hypothetical protein
VVQQAECLTIILVSLINKARNSIATIVNLIFNVVFFGQACAVELSLMTLAGLLTGYLSMLLFLGQPSLGVCAFQLLIYNVALAAAYTPLLIKTMRIYRIFAAATRGRPKPGMVSTKATLTVAAAIWMTQVCFGK